MAEVISLANAKIGEWRDVPTGQLRASYLMSSPPGSGLPQCFTVENSPYRFLGTHFHEQDQFQVIVQGTGTLGKHELAPYVVHFSRAYTPYGPIIAGPEGVTWLTLRAQRDEGGTQHLPQRMEVLKGVKDRKPWQVSDGISFDNVSDDGRLHPLPAIQDERGLGAFAVRLKPGASYTVPDASNTAGQFLVVVRGSAIKDGKASTGLATSLVKPGEPALTVTAGPEGLDALVLNFPRAAEAVQAAQPVAAAGQVWHCEPCGFMYDEAAGLPEEGIAPGTRWEDVPSDWQCPDCHSGKAEFTKVEF